MVQTVQDYRANVVEALLLEIAKRIQLPASQYRLAGERYDTISEYLNRDTSPLRGLVARLYPQGSIATGSVISSKFENDEFDIDVIAELDIRQDTPPARVLDNLFQALNGETGSRYHGKVKRRSRCVEVQYDNMHLDVTPAVRLGGTPERVSQIFHANEREPSGKHYTPIANPWGFADWFVRMVPSAAFFTDSVIKNAAQPLPDQDALNAKSFPLVALQLIKRWRNKVYDQRAGRMPPSVMLSYLIAKNVGSRATLFDELVAQAKSLSLTFQTECALGRLIDVKNPMCELDKFTDRWPASLAEQAQFMEDLKALNTKLEAIQKNPTPENCLRIMGELFGERPATQARDELTKRYAEKAQAGALRHHGTSGAIALAGSGLFGLGAATPSYATPKHTNFGSD